MKVLIASAHIRTSRSKLWRELQWQFLKENTGVDFEYAIIASGINQDLFPHADLVLQIPSVSHYECIQYIVDLFIKREDFSHLLLLDSDAWPIRSWFKILTDIISDRLYSAVMRVENYDDFPHPSAFFVKREALNVLDFGFNLNYYNLLGLKVSDVCSAMPQGEGEDKLWVPLIKTNVWSPHPMFAAVYGDLFYHHGAGSRSIGTRLAGLGVYDHILKQPDHRKIYNRLTSELKKNPKRFINKLRGKDNGF